VGWDLLDWFQLVQGRGNWYALVNDVVSIEVPENVECFLNT